MSGRNQASISSAADARHAGVGAGASSSASTTARGRNLAEGEDPEQRVALRRHVDARAPRLALRRSRTPPTRRWARSRSIIEAVMRGTWDAGPRHHRGDERRPHVDHDHDEHHRRQLRLVDHAGLKVGDVIVLSNFTDGGEQRDSAAHLALTATTSSRCPPARSRSNADAGHVVHRSRARRSC
jgi:hypothetical protein